MKKTCQNQQTNSINSQDTKSIYKKASVGFLYSNNKLPKTEVKKAIPFIIASKHLVIKHLVINIKTFSNKYNQGGEITAQ